MKFSKIETEYLTHTGKTSDISRQLALAGFAVLWVLKDGNSTSVIPDHLVPAAFFFGLSLFADLLQYLILSGSWTDEAFAAEKKVRAKLDEDSGLDPNEVDVPVKSAIHRLPRWLFWTKTRSVVGGYGWLLVALVYQIIVWR